MSRLKFRIFRDKRQLGETLEEFVLKKLDGNQAQLAKMLNTNPASVNQWVHGEHAMPAWAILEIFQRYPDARDFFLSDGELEPAPDPRRQALIERIDSLLEDEAMLKHLEGQIAICEDAKRQRDESGDSVQKLQEGLKNLFEKLSPEQRGRFRAEWSIEIPRIEREIRLTESPAAGRADDDRSSQESASETSGAGATGSVRRNTRQKRSRHS